MIDDKLLKNIARLHRELDEKIKPMPKACGVGCSFCCYQHFRIVAIEEHAISRFVIEKMPEQSQNRVRANLHAWFDYFDGNTPDVIDDDAWAKFEDKQRTDRFPCPFLLDHKCSIYEVRPVACRGHIEAESAINCGKDPGRISTPAARSVSFFAVGELIRLAGRRHFRSLCFAVAETFGIQKTRKLKRHLNLVGFRKGYDPHSK